MKTYEQRAVEVVNPVAKRLLHLMAKKQTNLAVSADVKTMAELLQLADQLGPEICVFKTHIDIVDDFSHAQINELTALAQKHDFIIFEDRKFADIGNTVVSQYQGGVYQIADWAPITNAHPIPGPGIVEGLASVGLAKGNGLLLLAEMSTKGNLFDQHYTQSVLEIAEVYPDFVIGFIATQRLNNNQNHIYMTPGVNVAQQGDKLGQSYLTPEQVIIDNRSDIIIVGRGIYQASSSLEAAQLYRQKGWQAYLQRVE